MYHPHIREQFNTEVELYGDLVREWKGENEREGGGRGKKRGGERERAREEGGRMGQFLRYDLKIST